MRGVSGATACSRLNPDRAAENLQHVFDRGRDGHGPQAEGPPPELQIGEREEVVDQPAEALGVPVDDGEEPAPRRRIVPGAAEERLRVALDGGEGGPELVRHVGHEVSPDHLEPAELRHVVEDEDEAERLSVHSPQAGPVRLERAPLAAAEGHVARHHRGAGTELASQLGQCGIAGQLRERAALAVELGRDVEDLPRAPVQQHDAAVEVRDQHALHHPAENRLDPLSLDAQLGDGRGHAPSHLAELRLEETELVTPLGGEIGRRPAGREPLGEADQPLQAAEHPAREGERGGEPEERRDHEPGEQEVIDACDVLLHGGEGQRSAHDPHLRRAGLPPGDVDEPRPDGRAVPDALATAAREGLAHLGSVCMVLERLGGPRRFAQHPTIGADDRQADAEIRRETPASGVERIPRRPGQGLPHDPHLGEQAPRQRVDLVALERDRDIGNRRHQHARERGERGQEEAEDEPTRPARRGETCTRHHGQ